MLITEGLGGQGHKLVLQYPIYLYILSYRFIRYTCKLWDTRKPKDESNTQLPSVLNLLQALQMYTAYN